MERPEVPDEAVGAAADTLEDAALRYLGRDLGTIHRDNIAGEALHAAAPIIGAEYLSHRDTLVVTLRAGGFQGASR